jgi:hypothetical protein
MGAQWAPYETVTELYCQYQLLYGVSWNSLIRRFVEALVGRTANLLASGAVQRSIGNRKLARSLVWVILAGICLCNIEWNASMYAPADL